MDMQVSVKPLFKLYDLAAAGALDRVMIEPNMSGLEQDPRNDWLYVTLSELRRLKQDRGGFIDKAGFIGSANGIDVIAALRMFEIGDLTVTDIVPEILPGIERNIRANISASRIPPKVTFIAGRDAQPLSSGYDLIYANLPLIMASEADLKSELATTTLTDATAYSSLGEGEHDLLVKWSLLPQLGFLLSAREKLNSHGSIITLIGGRVPDEAIAECFRRANMAYQCGSVSVMRQSDEEFVEQYAAYERQLGGQAFLFYDEHIASQCLTSIGEEYPSIVGHSANDIRAALESAALSATEAWAAVQSGRHIAHLAFGFRAWRA